MKSKSHFQYWRILVLTTTVGLYIAGNRSALANPITATSTFTSSTVVQLSVDPLASGNALVFLKEGSSVFKVAADSGQMATLDLKVGYGDPNDASKFLGPLLYSVSLSGNDTFSIPGISIPFYLSPGDVAFIQTTFDATARVTLNSPGTASASATATRTGGFINDPSSLATVTLSGTGIGGFDQLVDVIGSNPPLETGFASSDFVGSFISTTNGLKSSSVSASPFSVSMAPGDSIIGSNGQYKNMARVSVVPEIDATVGILVGILALVNERRRRDHDRKAS